MHSFCSFIPNFDHNFIGREGVVDIFFLVTFDIYVDEHKLWLMNECETQIYSFRSIPVKNFCGKNFFLFLLLL